MGIELVTRRSLAGSPSVKLSGVQQEFYPDQHSVYTFEGALSDLETLAIGCEGGSAPNGLLYGGFPSGSSIVKATVSSRGDGTGELKITAKEWGGFLEAKISSTFRISMVETTYELKDHPRITGNGAALKEVLLWLATDEKLRLADSNGDYHYYDAEGEEQTVEEEEAVDFCSAYTHGITQYVRYYPVIEKISQYHFPPGLSTNNQVGNVTGGSLSGFSEDIGTFSSPGVSLAGYPSTNWFKSGDEWSQNGDKSWTRTERWTYTPEGSSSSHAWIHEGDGDDD